MARPLPAPRKLCTIAIYNRQFFRIGVLIGIVVASLIATVAAQIVLGSIASSLIGLAGIAAVVGFIALFYYPADEFLLMDLDAAEMQRQDSEKRRDESATRLMASEQSLKALNDERSQLIATIEWQRASLLNRDWKGMRGDTWENFLVEVFRALGADAKRTRERAGSDQGVDLIVRFESQCFAIQAKGYGHPVGNKAIQEVFAGAKHWHCDAYAVVTNSEFTPKAKELANSTGCFLIEGLEFPDFVMGRIDLSRQPLNSEKPVSEVSPAARPDATLSE